MAPRKKPEAKPILATKFDFFDSVDALIQAVIMVDQAHRMAGQLGKRTGDGELIIPKPVEAQLDERMAKLRALVFTEESGAADT